MFRSLIGIGLLCLSLISCSRNHAVLHDSAGNTVKAAELRGKWVIINYWAAWCEGCVKEIPELNQFYTHTRNQNIILLGVNYDHVQMPDLVTWVNKERIIYPVLVEDPTKFFQLTDVDVLPMTFIIDPQGKLVKSMVGSNTEKSLLATLQRLQKKNETTL